MNEVVLCLGSNIEPMKHVQNAVSQLRSDFANVRLSAVYESVAVGFEGGNFLNLVVAFNSTLLIEQVLDYAQKLEAQAGRKRVARGRFDSRTLDVDLLLYGQMVGDFAGVRLPNPDVELFAHVLKPLCDLKADALHPVKKKPYQQLLNEVADDYVWRIKEDALSG